MLQKAGPNPSEAAIHMQEEWANTAEGKIEFNKYVMCKKNVKPMLKLLLNEKLNQEILNIVYIIV